MTRRLAGRLPPGMPPGRRVTARPKANPRHAAASGMAARERAPPWLRYHLKREILINGSQRETRVAILEDDRLVELLVDRPDHRRTVGDIYLDGSRRCCPAFRPRSSISVRRRAPSYTPPTCSSPMRMRTPPRRSRKNPRLRRRV